MAQTRVLSTQALKMLLGSHLQAKWPGVFAPLEHLGIHWGDPQHKIGVNVYGWMWVGTIPAELKGWAVIPCTVREITENIHTVFAKIEGLRGEDTCTKDQTSLS